MLPAYFVLAPPHKTTNGQEGCNQLMDILVIALALCFIPVPGAYVGIGSLALQDIAHPL